LDTGGFVLTLRGETSDGVGTISGAIRGGGGIVKTDDCTWVLGSTNAYTGLTILSKGTLRVTACDAVPPGSLVLCGGTLELVGSTAKCTSTRPAPACWN
jgi:autotransporter-associated beta strand protein